MLLFLLGIHLFISTYTLYESRLLLCVLALPPPVSYVLCEAGRIGPKNARLTSKAELKGSFIADSQIARKLGRP